MPDRRSVPARACGRTPSSRRLRGTSWPISSCRRFGRHPLHHREPGCSPERLVPRVGSAICPPHPPRHVIPSRAAMIDLLKAAVLGVVEGLTEFVPVSSTGHLIVASRLLGFGDPTFEIFIQLGAILALTWEYRATLVRLAGDGLRPGPAQRFIVRVLIAFLPAAVTGLLAHGWIESHLFRPSTVAMSLILGGIVILVLDGPGRRPGLGQVERVSLRQA